MLSLESVANRLQMRLRAPANGWPHVSPHPTLAYIQIAGTMPWQSRSEPRREFLDSASAAAPSPRGPDLAEQDGDRSWSS